MSTSTIGSATLTAKITQPDGYDIAISNDGTATAFDLGLVSGELLQRGRNEYFYSHGNE